MSNPYYDLEGREVRLFDTDGLVSPEAVPHGQVEIYDPDLGEYLINLHNGYYCEEGTRVAYNSWYGREEFDLVN